MAFAAPTAQAGPACYDKAFTQAQLTACAAADLKEADDRLNQLYRQMRDRMKGDENARSQLLDAQRKWLAFRDAECSFQTTRSAGGSIHAMTVNACLATLTQARSEALQTHLDCVQQTRRQDTAVCAVPRPH